MVIGSLVSSRLKVVGRAMEALQANVMVADAKLNIVYMNKALTGFLTEAEADLKKQLPQFNVATLVGSNIDVFHKNPAHQRQILAGLRARASASIQVGHRAFDMIVTPLKEGEAVTGFVVEWADAKERLQNLDYAAQIAAISSTQAVVEFTPEGEILSANENFLALIGYRLEEMRGRHHGLLLPPERAGSPAEQQFWAELAGGRAQAGEFERIGKNGRSLVLQESYNPIIDPKGRVIRISCFATDVTQRVRTVSALGDALQRLCAGDFAFALDEPFAPEFESLRRDLNLSVARLRQTFGDIAASAESLDLGAREINQGVGDLSRRTETQAASLEQTAAALDEITVNVSEAAKRAEDAMRVAQDARASAEKSVGVVASAVDAMGGIEKSSSEISSIIGVIDEIAFQTNLLALNAGVEAARAGEAGKGFAVVAQEVRELAQRSAAAAKEIKGLIRNSSGEVANGVKLVGDTGQSLSEISALIVEIAGHMEAISASAREQKLGLAEINAAVNQLDQTTQQNAAMVEEASAAAASMAQESTALGGMIGRFRTDDGTMRAGAASARGAGRSRAA